MADRKVIGVSQADIDKVAAADASPVPTKTAAQFMRNTKVKALFPENRRAIVTATSDATVGDVFSLLTKEKISSVPLEAKGPRKGSGYDAFVDVVDLVTHFVGRFSHEELSAENFDKARAAATAPAREAASSRSSWYPVEAGEPLLAACKHMVAHNVKRLPVLDEGGELITVVTQSALLNLISKNADKFSELLSKTVDALKIGYKDVLKVNEKEETITAFRLIHEKGVTGVAVVNDKDELVGNISATDLREIGFDGSMMSKLFLPAGDFVALVAEKSQDTDRPISGPIAVTPSATMEEVFAKIEMTRAHRVFIVEGSKPIGVISIVDILDAVLKTI